MVFSKVGRSSDVKIRYDISQISIKWDNRLVIQRVSTVPFRVRTPSNHFRTTFDKTYDRSRPKDLMSPTESFLYQQKPFSLAFSTRFFFRVRTHPNNQCTIRRNRIQRIESGPCRAYHPSMAERIPAKRSILSRPVMRQSPSMPYNPTSLMNERYVILSVHRDEQRCPRKKWRKGNIRTSFDGKCVDIHRFQINDLYAIATSGNQEGHPSRGHSNPRSL